MHRRMRLYRCRLDMRACHPASGLACDRFFVEGSDAPLSLSGERGILWLAALALARAGSSPPALEIDWTVAANRALVVW